MLTGYDWHFAHAAWGGRSSLEPGPLHSTFAQLFCVIQYSSGFHEIHIMCKHLHSPSELQLRIPASLSGLPIILKKWFPRIFARLRGKNWLPFGEGNLSEHFKTRAYMSEEKDCKMFIIVYRFHLVCASPVAPLPPPACVPVWRDVFESSSSSSGSLKGIRLCESETIY